MMTDHTKFQSLSSTNQCKNTTNPTSNITAGN